MRKKLLKEIYQIQITEGMIKEFQQMKADGQPIVVIGIIQRGDQKNQNGRIYPYNILKKECDRYLEDVVRKGLAIGELDHTEEPVIQLKNVSHVIDDIWWDGPEKKDVYGKIRLLSTPAGKIAENILLSGIPLGISSRAVGSVSKNEAQGVDIVGEDLNIICWDLVGTPSTNDAYLRLHEAREIKDFDPNKVLPPKMRLEQALKELLGKEK